MPRFTRDRAGFGSGERTEGSEVQRFHGQGVREIHSIASAAKDLLGSG